MQIKSLHYIVLLVFFIGIRSAQTSKLIHPNLLMAKIQLCRLYFYETYSRLFSLFISFKHW
uniref:Uncharacterized protein n=1 Tax=Solanum lycopersicum TaxID=4081 RepID=A0A3Q7JFE2_SOLLC